MRNATRGLESRTGRHPAGQVALAAVAQLLAMTLWFSATAVLPSLAEAWQLDGTEQAWLTAAVQLGFVVGALAAATLNLPDLIAPRTLVAVAAIIGAGANFAIGQWVESLAPALGLRFLTGMSLACVYPPGMKIVAGHVSGRARGLAMGVLIGSLTLGSAAPHLVASLFASVELPVRAVFTTSSSCAVVGGLIIRFLVTDGPYAAPAAPFDPRQIGNVFRNRAVRLANFGYCGHMWELYAMWTWIAVFVARSLGEGSDATARGVAFVTIGVAGVIGATVAGWWADRIGRTRVTIIAMAISCACCLVSPALFGASLTLLVVFGVVWGASAVADSAQFSAAVTELADRDYVGTALTLQTSVGFALTMVTIQGLPWVADLVGWQYAFLVLAPGPALGCVAMARLRRCPEAAAMAGGNR